MKEITEGNKVIAEFMEWKTFDKLPHKFRVPNLYPVTLTTNDHRSTGWIETDTIEMLFHTSWDWLMPVIEKIAKMRFPDAKESDEDYNDTPYPRTFGMLTESGKFMFRFNRFPLFEADELIEAAYPAVIDFIQWYNQNKPLST